jgi:hypothetical protein
LRGFPAAADDAVVRNAIRARDSPTFRHRMMSKRLRTGTIEWSQLLGELSALGLRSYLELEEGDAKDPLLLYCVLDDGLLVDLWIDDDAFPPTPRRRVVTAIGSSSLRDTRAATARRSRSRATSRSRVWRAAWSI